MTDTGYIVSVNSFSDADLVEMFNNGNDHAFTVLTNRYLGVIRSITSKYRISGLDHEDLTQEGLLGLLCAVKTFRADKGASFRTYAGLCINRRIISQLGHSKISKEKPLNNYISLDDSQFENESFMLDEVMNPEELVVNRENIASMKKSISDCLSAREKNVFELYLAGESYGEISRLLNLSQKSVDNALQRIRKKLKKHISNIPL